MDSPDHDDRLDMYADGELDAEKHAADVEGIEANPDQKAYVHGVRHLKNSLSAHWSGEKAPPDAGPTVCAALDAIDHDLGAGHGPPRHCSRRLMAGPAVAIAAGLALAFGAWQWWPAPPGQKIQLVSIEANRLSTATDAHQEIVAAYVAHGSQEPPDALLASSREDARRVLSDNLGLPIQAPNLKRAGFDFFGSRQCLVERMPAAQLVYRHEKSGVLLSLFTAARLHYLGQPSRAHGVREVFFAEPDGLTTLAWNVGGATYLACAALPQSEVLSALGMANAVVRAAGLFRAAQRLAEIVTPPLPRYDVLEDVPSAPHALRGPFDAGRPRANTAPACSAVDQTAEPGYSYGVFSAGGPGRRDHRVSLTDMAVWRDRAAPPWSLS